MRALTAILTSALAACSAGDGAILELSTPDGPMTADHIDVVLASSAATDVDKQQSSPGKGAETVVYFHQRAIGGSVASVGALDGFTVRLEANLAVVGADELLVPFVLAYDAQGTLVAVGAQLPADGPPGGIAIEANKAVRYIVPMQKVTAVGPEVAVEASQVLPVSCRRDNSAWPSGIAWRPRTGPELRLLFPEPDATAVNLSPTDASGRPLDLDCDGHEAGADDCDDVREDIYLDAPGARVCDGMDRTCRGAPLVQACTDTAGQCMTSQLCDPAMDGVGTVGECFVDASCACAAGQADCHHCTLDYTQSGGGGGIRTCDPAVGALALEGCTEGTPCSLDVYTGPGWDATLAVDPVNPIFEQHIDGVMGHFALRVERIPDVVVVGANGNVGAVVLRVTQGPQVRFVEVALDVETSGGAGCTSIGNGNSMMYCL